jgi:hypothetical protein
VRAIIISLPLLIFAALVSTLEAAEPECAALVALQTSRAQTSQWSAAITVEVPSCRRSKGRFALMTQAETMNGRIEIAERGQEWRFDGHGKGQFVYVIDQPSDVIITDVWIRQGVRCACLE